MIENRGDVYWIKLIEIELGEYAGPILLSSIMEKTLSGKYDLKYFNFLTEKAAPYQNFTLYFKLISLWSNRSWAKGLRCSNKGASQGDHTAEYPTKSSAVAWLG